MQAVILAAGVGSRLGTVSNGLPKCLLTIADRPLIEHQLEILADAGIGQVLVVVGYKADEIRKVVSYRAEYVENQDFRETNSLYSLWLARQWVTGPFVLMNGDLLFHPQILDRLMAKNGNALAFDATSSSGQEQTKVFVRDGRVWDLGKDLAPELVRGESLGLMTFDAEGRTALFNRVEAMVRHDGRKSWVMEAVRSMCSAVKIHAVNITGLPWVEMDFPFDLDRAQRKVWPAIQKDRWKTTVHWRVTRWAALAAAALLLVSSAVLITLGLRTQEIEWTTIAPAGAEEVLLHLSSGTQRWWGASGRSPVRVYTTGPSALRAEFRLLAMSSSALPGRYVVQVSVDGTPAHWEVFKATMDADASLAGLAVGDRDRYEFAIPEGHHAIEVLLLGGAGDSMLARIRDTEPATPEDDEEIQ